MEDQTAFDLNQAIQRWRESLGQSPAFRSENLNELESHLRDSIATLQARGLSEGEAFLIATRRIGEGRQLEAEFGKVNGKSVWLERLLWMLIGVQVWMAMSALCSAATFYANKAANFLSQGAGYYSDAQRKWITTHGVGAISIILTILANLAPAILLGLVFVIAWKILIGSTRMKRGLTNVFLTKPVHLGVVLFAVCFGLQFVAACLLKFGEQQWYWWQIILMQVVFSSPRYLVGSILIAMLARKRLRVSVAR